MFVFCLVLKGHLDYWKYDPDFLQDTPMVVGPFGFHGFKEGGTLNTDRP